MSGPLAGVVLACSSYQAGDDASNTGTLVSGRTYDSLRDQAKALGAKVSGILHKNVAALVATAEACSQGTQRVRKALRFSVPIVSPAWLDACVSAGRILPTDSFEQEIGVQARLKVCTDSANKRANSIFNAKSEVPPSKSKDIGVISKQCSHNLPGKTVSLQHNEGAAAAEAWVSSAGITVDFGCVCSCHDADCEPFLGQEATTCEWCESLHESTKSSALQASEADDCNTVSTSAEVGRVSALQQQSIISVDALAAEALVSNAGVTVDFGCSCSCHDADCEPFLGQEAISCEWCESLHASTLCSAPIALKSDGSAHGTRSVFAPGNKTIESASYQQRQSSAKTLAADALVSTAGVTIDFGCSCSCHDIDCEPFFGQDASHCEWCESLHADIISSVPPAKEADHSDNTSSVAVVQGVLGVAMAPEQNVCPQCQNDQAKDAPLSLSSTKVLCSYLADEEQNSPKPEGQRPPFLHGIDSSFVAINKKRKNEEIAEDKGAICSSKSDTGSRIQRPDSSTRRQRK
jgi:hypothetical protein